jgi:hypothetical protein
VREGFLAVENPSTKGRTYRLAEAYERLVVAQDHDSAAKKHNGRR